MPRFRLNRRDVLRGTGAIAIGLPWLEAMDPVKTAGAQTAPAPRFLAVYQPGGTVMENWRPTGTETDFTFGSILTPLEPIKNKLLILSGLDMPCALAPGGEQHQAGMVGWLSGQAQTTAQTFEGVNGPSIDQVIAETASAGKPRPSIEMAIRWATGKSVGALHPMNAMTFANDGNASPIPPRIDPADIYDSLFGGLETGDDGSASANVARQQSILDFLDQRYVTVSQKLGTSDRARLEEHLTRIREMEDSLAALGGVDTATCTAPELVDTTGYNPRAGELADLNDNGACAGSDCVTSDEMIPTVGKLFMDMMVMAFACDLTGVGTLQWSDSEAKHTFPWLGLSEHHHFYQHDGGFKPNECTQIDVWYSEEHLYLLQKLDSIDMGDHTLLDETVVFFGSEISKPDIHSRVDMPFMMAGGGGGLRPGRFLQFNGESHNDLLAAILNLFGNQVSTFGNASYGSGSPLSGLT